MTDAAGIAEDIALNLNNLLNLTLDFTSQIKKKDYVSILDTVVSKIHDVIANASESNALWCSNSILQLIVSIPSAQNAERILEKFLKTVREDRSGKHALQLQILTNIFNSSALYPQARYDALICIIQCAVESNQLQLISKNFDQVEQKLDAKLLESPECRRKLYFAIADALGSQKGARIQSLKYLAKYLDSFSETQDSDTMDVGKDVAVRATQLLLQNPIAGFSAQIDIVSNPAVKNLGKYDSTCKLFELLTIFSTKSWKDYASFRDGVSNSFFEDHGLVEEVCASNMRLLTLCCFEKSTKPIPFQMIADALCIDENQVEHWIIKAITSKIVTGKVDQVRSSVVISKCLQRGFAPEQWKELQKSLHMYKKNVGSLIETIRNARQVAQAS